MSRQSWDYYFMTIAKDVAARSTCPRAAVGAVIVKDNHILTTGYNGAPTDEPHCTDAGCLMVNGHCERTVHAETNAVAQAARFGVSVDGATMYCWSNRHLTDDIELDAVGKSVPQCIKCNQVMKQAGIIRFVEGGKDFC